MSASMATIHILRHGEARHNVVKPYPYRDPSLTGDGIRQAEKVLLPAKPDLIIVSPMTRTIQTTLVAFRQFLDESSAPAKTEVQIWPELREAHDAICNKGVGRAEIAAAFPQFDFSSCPEEWDYPPHSVEGATLRAETVRRRLMNLSASYENIFLVTHRGLIAFLVEGPRFDVCECRSYRFASADEVENQRYGTHEHTGDKLDFGPSLLVPLSS
ncbi:unnamed protein product [Clonostachys byssicola]|uniref:Uncharacterized protein n=1 Tax=Clonostachys byssicola TaxID=160290 RepID=A0A9N9UDU3_9HYPO|nr:unnamed protein product [Clonostachys byssicola]